MIQPKFGPLRGGKGRRRPQGGVMGMIAAWWSSPARQAMAHAIKLKPILQDLMGELFIPAGMIVVPHVKGYDPELDQPPFYDPE